MISFALTQEQETAREAMRNFAADVLRPAAREHDEASTLPESFLAQAWELGLVPTQLPETVGGYGEARSPLTNAIVLEELAYGDATLALAAIAPAAFAYAIADQGTDEQKRAYLPAFCGSNFTAAAVAIAEPSPGFDVAAPQTRAERGKDGYLLTGRKCFVAFGDRAEHLLVAARCNGRSDLFLVPRGAAGLSVSATEKNLGLKALPTATIELDGVPIPYGNRLGGDAGADVQRVVDHSRVALAAVLTGLSRAVLDYCLPYTKERVAFDEPIAQKQSIAFRLAEMHMETECCRWMTWKAASQLEQGLEATRSAHLARLFAAEKAMWIADNGVQCLGGHGFIREHPVEMWYRNARTLGVLEGVIAV
ncbi:MAG TPA: acyl-CoA dehydrogenase family protein [Terriglobales bacterium]|nr:acyl-CoA dehydrogenase family protein [Terriglobales bacterium]